MKFSKRQGARSRGQVGSGRMLVVEFSLHLATCPFFSIIHLAQIPVAIRRAAPAEIDLAACVGGCVCNGAIGAQQSGAVAIIIQYCTRQIDDKVAVRRDNGAGGNGNRRAAAFSVIHFPSRHICAGVGSVVQFEPFVGV